MSRGSFWSKSLRETLATVAGAGLGASVGGWLGGPLLAFVGAIFGCAVAAAAHPMLDRGPASPSGGARRLV